jgi:hypothetical protein
MKVVFTDYALRDLDEIFQVAWPLPILRDASLSRCSSG